MSGDQGFGQGQRAEWLARGYTELRSTAERGCLLSVQRHESPSGDASRPLTGGRSRVTRQGQAVDEVLRAAGGFRTAQDLHSELRRRGHSVGLTTVYRHLRSLADTGEIDVVHRPDGEAQYRLCGSAGGTYASGADHHHHLVCRTCGRAVEVEGPEVEAWAESVAAAAGYTEISHTLEVFGLCPEHSAPRQSSPRRAPRRAAARRAGG